MGGRIIVAQCHALSRPRGSTAQETTRRRTVPDIREPQPAAVSAVEVIEQGAEGWAPGGAAGGRGGKGGSITADRGSERRRSE
jgi:hypothetical protein